MLPVDQQELQLLVQFARQWTRSSFFEEEQDYFSGSSWIEEVYRQPELSDDDDEATQPLEVALKLEG